jgi:hypothetical protein
VILSRGGRALDRLYLATFFFLLFTSHSIHAEEPQETSSGFTTSFFFLYAHPAGSLAETSGDHDFSLDKSLGFDDYPMGSGLVDWRFKKRQHLLFYFSPNQVSRSAALSKTVVFQGESFAAGTGVNTQLRTLSFAPGYEYDVVRNERGHLGAVAQLNILDIKGSIQASVHASENAGNTAPTGLATGSLLTFLPLLGPDGRFYLIRGSDRLFIDGNLKGMYFFGYGNFLSAASTVGVKVSSHLNLQLGYTLASRVVIDGDIQHNQLSVHLTQRGPLGGLAYSW